MTRHDFEALCQEVESILSEKIDARNLSDEYQRTYDDKMNKLKTIYALDGETTDTKKETCDTITTNDFNILLDIILFVCDIPWEEEDNVEAIQAEYKNITLLKENYVKSIDELNSSIDLTKDEKQKKSEELRNKFLSDYSIILIKIEYLVKNNFYLLPKADTENLNNKMLKSLLRLEEFVTKELLNHDCRSGCIGSCKGGAS